MSDLNSTCVPNDGEIRWLPVESVGLDNIDEFIDTIMVTESTGHVWHAVISEDLDHIPHTDNLAAVARVLAAHSGIGEALSEIIDAASAWISDFDDNTEPGSYYARKTKALALVHLLAAALNGGAS